MAKDKKLDIIKAAEKRFSKYGLNKTTLEEIARDLRIGKATIYYYFESKETLYYETLNFEIEEYLEKVKIIFNDERLELKSRFFEYLKLKLSLKENYNLIFVLLIHLISGSELENEKKIANSFLEKECNILHMVLNSFRKDSSESKNLIDANYIIAELWGLIFFNELLSKINSIIDLNQTDIQLSIVEKLLNPFYIQ